MKSKIKSRELWIAVLSKIVFITIIITEVCGTTRMVAGVIGTIAASISYMIAECRVDIARVKIAYEEVDANEKGGIIKWKMLFL